MNNFFIVGCGRSGTSLLQSILSNHSVVTIPPETGFYSLIIPEILKYTTFPVVKHNEKLKLIDIILSHERISGSGLDLEQLGSELLDLKRIDRKSIVEIFLSSYLKKSNKDLWGEKTPRHVMYLDEIKQDFESSKIIFLVRDPRAVAASFKNVEASFGSKNVLTACRQWKEALLSYQKFAINYSDDSLLVKYEKLVSKKSDILINVQDFLQLPHESIDSNFKGNSNFLPGQYQHMKNTKKDVFDTSINKWQSELNFMEIAAIEYYLGDYMNEHGYEKSISTNEIIKLFCYIFYFSFWPFERVFNKIRVSRKI